MPKLRKYCCDWKPGFCSATFAIPPVRWFRMGIDCEIRERDLDCVEGIAIRKSRYGVGECLSQLPAWVAKYSNWGAATAHPLLPYYLYVQYLTPWQAKGGLLGCVRRVSVADGQEKRRRFFRCAVARFHVWCWLCSFVSRHPLLLAFHGRPDPVPGSAPLDYCVRSK